MIKLKYELKKEEYEDEEPIEIIEITAETNAPSTSITFEKNDALLAKTHTNNEGLAVCGFSPENKKCIIKAMVNDETAEITVPKLGGIY